MPNKTKNQIADELYGDEFEYLSAGEKAAVTRTYNAQRNTRRTPVSSTGIKGTIGRVGVNGTKTCILNTGATIADLLDQSGYTLDVKKEKIINVDTGNNVDLTDEVKHNGTYAIAVEIKSA